VKLTEAHFPDFALKFNEYCKGVLTPELRQKVLQIDDEVSLSALTPSVVDEIERLEPFGMGNPRPLLLASNLRVLGEPRIVGPRQNHLQIRFLQDSVTVKAIGWNLAERGRTLRPNTVCSVVFHPSINEWNGRREVQLEIKDFAGQRAGIE